MSLDPQRWVVYATFSADGRPSSAALAQVREYRRIGFEVLVVDSSTSIEPARVADWDSAASAWFKRANIGYDFGSYKAGLNWLISLRAVSLECMALILTNDSCFGPFVPFDRVLCDFEEQGDSCPTVYGLTDSAQFGYHLQSYWLYFPSGVAIVASEFLSRMETAQDRDDAIAHGELAFGEYMKRAGIAAKAYCHYSAAMDTLTADRGRVLSIIDLATRRFLKRPRFNRCADAQCLRHLLGLRSDMHRFNPAVLFGPSLFRLRPLPLLKRSIFRENVYEDRRVPTGCDSTTLDNRSVEQIFASIQ